MAIGYGSVAVNDQLVPLPVQSAYNPWSFGPVYSGPAYWPRQGVYNVPPIITPGSIAQVSGAQIVPGQPAAGMTHDGLPSPTMPTQTDLTGNPLSLTHSPVWWALGFLAVGLLMLHHIHYKD
jgi:hypothetical protein